MALTDVYCRVNRARGLELLSPEDLLNACRQLSLLNMPIVLRIFDSGVMVLQTQTHSDFEVAESLAELVQTFFQHLRSIFQNTFCNIVIFYVFSVIL